MKNGVEPAVAEQAVTDRPEDVEEGAVDAVWLVGAGGHRHHGELAAEHPGVVLAAGEVGEGAGEDVWRKVKRSVRSATTIRLGDRQWSTGAAVPDP